MEEVALARGSRRSSEFEACAYVIGGGLPVVEEVALARGLRLLVRSSRPAPTSSEEDFPSLEEVAHRRSWRVIYSKKLEVFGGSWQAREEEKKAE